MIRVFNAVRFSLTVVVSFLFSVNGIEGGEARQEISGLDSPGILYQDHKLVASSGAREDFLGSSVSVFGNVAVAGAPVNFPESRTGYACVYRFDGTTWVEEQRLQASDNQPENQFGFSVSTSGDVVVVSAPYDDEMGYATGSAYVYRYDGSSWIEEQKLLAPDAASMEFFGHSVSISGDVIIVGAHGFVTEDTGSAYIYRYDGSSWVEEEKLVASDAIVGHLFGYRVAISGDVAAVGALFDGDMGLYAGSVYIYRFDGAAWTEEQKLLASDGVDYDYFGYSLSLADDFAAIGATHRADMGVWAGAVYTYRFDGISWIEGEKLFASDAAEEDQFGWTVSASGDDLLVGSPYSDLNPSSSAGSAYLFRYDGTTWNEVQKFLASDGESSNVEFGYSVSISGDVGIVGRHKDRDLEFESGAVYAFDLSEGLINLTLTRTLGISIRRGGSLTFDSMIQNASGNPVSGDYWLSVVMPNSQEIEIPDNYLNHANPLSGQVPALDTIDLGHVLDIPQMAPTGWYTLVGRIGIHPDMILDTSTFPFQVIE
jgi:hypothetical protein